MFDADIQQHEVFRQLVVDLIGRIAGLSEPSVADSCLRPEPNLRKMFIAPLVEAFLAITGSAKGDRLGFWNLVAAEVPFSPMDRLDADGFVWPRGKKPNRTQDGWYQSFTGMVDSLGRSIENGTNRRTGSAQQRMLPAPAPAPAPARSPAPPPAQAQAQAPPRAPAPAPAPQAPVATAAAWQQAMTLQMTKMQMELSNLQSTVTDLKRQLQDLPAAKPKKKSPKGWKVCAH